MRDPAVFTRPLYGDRGVWTAVVIWMSNTLFAMHCWRYTAVVCCYTQADRTGATWRMQERP
jgi:hypothetical protein